MIYPLFEHNDAELRKYFTRRTYRGAVVRVSALQMDEWVVLVGDAAHSVLPPTGEGINSGLEDCEVLTDALLRALGGGTSNGSSGNGSSDGAGHNAATAASLAPCTARTPWFGKYQQLRLRDLQGLGTIAAYLNDSNDFRGAKQAAGICFTILQAVLKKCGVFRDTYEDLTFGPKAVERTPYGDIGAMWVGRKKVLFPLCQACCFSVAFVWGLLTAPLKLFALVAMMGR
jgi:kynurenine 3-monooxygenase